MRALARDRSDQLFIPVPESVQIRSEEAGKQALDLHWPGADWNFSIVIISMTGTGSTQ